MSKHESRSGIALIVVIGFLGILTLLAVTLAVSMRTERLASEVNKDAVKNRHFLQSALAAAMNTINTNLLDVNPTNGVSAAFGVPRPINNRIPKAWAVFESIGSGQAITNTSSLLKGEAAEWLPSRYLNPVDPDYAASNIARQAEWIYVADPVASGTSGNPWIGRYAYIAVDCTGLLDANVVGTKTPFRDGGTNLASEIDIAFLPEVGGIARRDYFVDNRNFYGTFYTYPEIVGLNNGVFTTGQTETLALTSDGVENLFPYSLSNDRGRWDRATESWATVGPNGESLDVRGWSGTDASNVFERLGYLDPGAMADAFVDFTDGNFLPLGNGVEPNATNLCAESVPMINEITVINELDEDLGTGEYVHTITMEVEIWYPFPATVNGTPYTLTVDENTADPMFAGSGIHAGILPVGGSKSVPFTVDPAVPFQTVVFPVWEGRKLKATYAPDPPVVPLQVAVSAYRLQITEAGGVIDEVIAPYFPTSTELTLLLPPLRFNVGFPQTQPFVQSTRVNDPRLNHNTSEWLGGDPSLGAVNTVDFAGFGVSATNGEVEGFTMYVRNSTNLETAAELGFIHLNDTWSTIDLFSPEGADLLGNYRVATWTGDVYASESLVHPYSQFDDVWGAIFRDTPIERYPDDPSASTNSVSATLADALANAVTIHSASNGVHFDALGTAIDGRAAWAAAPLIVSSQNVWSADGNISLDNNQKESILANSFRMFSAHQNIFTVIVVAQTLNDIPDSLGNFGTLPGTEDIVTGERRAVAVVWRDPYPDPITGRNEMFIRHMRYLDE